MNHSTLANYKLIRKIGEGGFGIVWLAQKVNSNEFIALKEVTSENISGHEIKALKLYAETFKNSPSEGIIPILEVIIENDTIYYTMPLCDGVNGAKPTDSDYAPLTLWQLIEDRLKQSTWFSKKEIADIISPIISAADTLAKVGLLHRDIKPANILFFNGKPYLADIGLLAKDVTNLLSAGTPDFTAPEWYTRSNGSPDMWGCATTLFYLLTGNSPSLMGREAYRWQPCGKSKMPKDDIATWLDFNNAINRATSEEPNERFLRFEDFKKTIFAIANGYKTESDYPLWIPLAMRLLFAHISKIPPKFRHIIYASFIGVIALLISSGVYLINSLPEITEKSSQNYYANLWKITGESMQKQYDKLLLAKSDDEKLKYFDNIKKILIDTSQQSNTLENFCFCALRSEISEHHQYKIQDLYAQIIPIFAKRNQTENIEIINKSLVGRYCFVNIGATTNANASELEKSGYKLMKYSEALRFKSKSNVKKRHDGFKKTL